MNYEPLYTFAEKHRVPYNELCTALRAALAAPQPEPVAWKCAKCGNTSDCEGVTVGDNWCNSCAVCGEMKPLYATAPPAAPDLKHKPTVQRLMDLARKFRSAPGDLYDGAYKELQSACYEALSAAPAVPAVCDGGTCGLGGYCTNCPRLSAAPAVREPQDERIRWRDAVIKEAESALRTAEQEFADMPTWANMGHAAKKVTHALAVIAVLGIGGGGK